jgi:deoxyadenosine kinase
MVPVINTVDKMFISVCGMIGAGKSCLATKLGKIMNLPVFYEEVIEIDNHYLEDFYKDMKSNAFSLQIQLLHSRMEQLKKIRNEKNGCIQDRTIYEDTIFVSLLHDEGYIDDKSYNAYKDLFSTLTEYMVRPTIIIFIDVLPHISLERILNRNREMEGKITLEYLTKLYNKYQQFIKDISRISPVIKVDWNTFGNEDKMVEKIKLKYDEIQRIHTITC